MAIEAVNGPSADFRVRPRAARKSRITGFIRVDCRFSAGPVARDALSSTSAAIDDRASRRRGLHRGALDVLIKDIARPAPGSMAGMREHTSLEGRPSRLVRPGRRRPAGS